MRIIPDSPENTPREYSGRVLLSDVPSPPHKVRTPVADGRPARWTRLPAPNRLRSRSSPPDEDRRRSPPRNRRRPGGTPNVCVCVYYCRTYYKAVCGGGSGTREEPGTLTLGAPVFPGSSRLGIEPKTPGWLVQDPTTRPIGDLIPTIRGSGAHLWRGWDP
jgi:hypothetical protein